ncbi:MAG: phosphoribosylformylglycinamidine synthase subunit PurQ [Rhodobacteraceae bacterium]|nr:phosphoribosylformylglycinamidine synthase subunit PurQ [Paracoccaceae bacterium]
MRAAVLTFPGSNCERDLARAFAAHGFAVDRVWHKEAALPAGVDIVAIPGGYSFGDYLRCGAIAARAPVMAAVARHAARGGHVIGICNGFQILTEAGLLPGTLMRNAGLRFVCRRVGLCVATTASPFTALWARGAAIALPIAHHDGNYAADPPTLDRLEGEDRIAFRYRENPNGAARDIAGILSANRRVLGMMPHPERAIEAAQGGADGVRLFLALAGALAAA